MSFDIECQYLFNHQRPHTEEKHDLQVREAWVPLPEHVQGFRPDWDRSWTSNFDNLQKHWTPEYDLNNSDEVMKSL